MTTATVQQRDPETANKHFEAGYKAEQTYDRPTAVQEYQTAHDADPQDANICFRLAYNTDMLGEDEQAIALYEQCIEQETPSVNALINLAVLYEDTGEHLKAEQCLRRILATDPNHPRARLYLKDVQASRQMTIDDRQQQQQEKYTATLDTPVSDFDLTVQARNGLRRMDIRTLGDLVKITESELRASNNFTDASLEQIKTMLAQRGLKLGGRIAQATGTIMEGLEIDQTQSDTQPLLERSINDLDLSVRARKALNMLSIDLIGDLASKTEEELLGVKNFGITSLLEIKEKLLSVGVKLRELDPDQIQEGEEGDENK